MHERSDPAGMARRHFGMLVETCPYPKGSDPWMTYMAALLDAAVALDTALYPADGARVGWVSPFAGGQMGAGGAETVLPRGLADRLRREAREARQNLAAAARVRLTPDQLRVLNAALRGDKIAVIAVELGLSLNSVKHHMRQLRKMGLLAYRQPGPRVTVVRGGGGEWRESVVPLDQGLRWGAAE